MLSESVCLSLRLCCTTFCLDSSSFHFCGFFLWQIVCCYSLLSSNSMRCGAAYPCIFCTNLAFEDWIYTYLFFTTEMSAFVASDFTGTYFSKTGVALYSKERIPYLLQLLTQMALNISSRSMTFSSFGVCCNFHYLQSSV